MFPPPKKIKRTEDFFELHARPNCPPAITIQNQDHNHGQSSILGFSTTTSVPIAESLEPPYDVRSERLNHLAMSLSNLKAARAARQKALEDRMPAVLAASQRLQSVLGYSNCARPLAPAIFPQLRDKPVWMKNAGRLVASLRMCKNFAVGMNRTSESLEFLDRSILSDSDTTASAAIESRTKLMAPHSQSTSVTDATNMDHGIEDAVAFGIQDFGNAPEVGKVDLDDDTSSPTEVLVATYLVANNGPGITETSAVAANIVSGENESTMQTNKENTRPSKLWPKILVPDPKETLGPFTDAICHQRNFHARPLLTLTLRERTPLNEYSATSRGKLLVHFEVGLDNVKALCQGTFMIDDSFDWEEICKQQHLPKPAKAKEDIQAKSQGMEQHQTQEGYGQEPWLFFGVSFRRTAKEKLKGERGKWACFGVPVRSCSSNTSNYEAATVGGGCDSEGISVPPYSAKVRRLESRISKEGTFCMDLWRNVGEWRGGVWSQVEQAMANNALMVSSLSAMEEFAAA